MPGKRVCNKKGRQRKVPARSRKTQLRHIMKRLALRRRLQDAKDRLTMRERLVHLFGGDKE